MLVTNIKLPHTAYILLRSKASVTWDIRRYLQIYNRPSVPDSAPYAAPLLLLSATLMLLSCIWYEIQNICTDFYAVNIGVVYFYRHVFTGFNWIVLWLKGEKSIWEQGGLFHSNWTVTAQNMKRLRNSNPYTN